MRKLRCIGLLVFLCALAGATAGAFLLVIAHEMLNALRNTPVAGSPPMGHLLRTAYLIAFSVTACLGIVAFSRRPRRERAPRYRTVTVHRARTAV